MKRYVKSTLRSPAVLKRPANDPTVEAGDVIDEAVVVAGGVGIVIEANGATVDIGVSDSRKFVPWKNRMSPTKGLSRRCLPR
jgi:hypothetical protein